MPARKESLELKLRAVCFILLLMSSSCYRIASIARTFEHRTSDEIIPKGVFGGSDVCSISKTEGAVERYKSKVDTILDLSDKVSETGSMLDMVQLKNRLKRFKSCGKPEILKAMPQEFKDFVLLHSSKSDSKYKEANVLYHVVEAVFLTNESKVVFPQNGTCSFSPASFKDSSTTFFRPSLKDPEEARLIFFTEIFGCAEPEAQSYIASLPWAAQRTVKLFVDMGMASIKSRRSTGDPDAIQEAEAVASKLRDEAEALATVAEEETDQIKGSALAEVDRIDPVLAAVLGIGSPAALPFIGVSAFGLLIICVVAFFAFNILYIIFDCIFGYCTVGSSGGWNIF